MVGHHVIVVWQSERLRQGKAVFLILVINGKQRRKTVHLTQTVLWLFALGIAEAQVGINVEDVFAHVHFHAGIVLAEVIAQKDTLVVSMVIGYGILCRFAATAHTEHIVLG